jgi:hypothetical protein
MLCNSVSSPLIFHRILTPVTSVNPDSITLLLQYYLYMDGRGSYQFKPIEPDTEEFGS